MGKHKSFGKEVNLAVHHQMEFQLLIN